MIRTLTLVRCDSCPAELVGCNCLGAANREMNALAVAREEGWRRLPVGDRAADYCLDCFACLVLKGMAA
jgi:hypothetical protein